MGQQQMGRLADLVRNEPGFRDRFRSDPVAAAKGAGIELDDDDVRALQSQKFADLSDSELVDRMSAARGDV